MWVRARLQAHHQVSDDDFERYYAAQVIWDEGMASRVAGFVNGHQEVTHMVVLAGLVHIAYGRGIPNRAAKRGRAPGPACWR